MLRALDRLPAPRPELEALEDRVVPAGLVGDLVNFGDSLTDTGNVSLATGGAVPPSAFYFQGRYSGGPIWVDTLAEYLGEATPTPSLAGGKNFAFGGARLTAGFNPYGTPTIGQQVGLYYLAGNDPDADDVFTLWAGANDFFFSNGTADPAAVAAAMGDAIEMLIAGGGTTFVVANLPLLGQTPFFQDLGVQPLIDGANLWSAAYNFYLDLELDALDALPGVAIVAIDMPAVFTELVAENPLGLTDFDDAVGPYDAAGFLTAITADPDEYLFYDSVHPGSPAHQYVGLQAAADVLESLGASTVWVKTTADTVDPLDGKVSLREAVHLTNAMADEQTILFSLGNGAKTITLGSQLALTDDTNIVGTGTNKLTLSGGNATRIFHVAAGADVDLAAMTLRNGRAEQGGAIYNAGDLTVVDVVFQNNTATGANARGGAIYNTGDLDVVLSAFIGNKAIGTGLGTTAYGGAIATEGASARAGVYLSSLNANEARGRDARGGAIYAGADSSLTLAGSVVRGNRAHATSGGTGYGGGVYLANDVFFALLLSSLSGNSASTAGANLFAE